jgi:hypothetical protein
MPCKAMACRSSCEKASRKRDRSRATILAARCLTYDASSSYLPP